MERNKATKNKSIIQQKNQKKGEKQKKRYI
jgi:hypothetical protein